VLQEDVVAAGRADEHPEELLAAGKGRRRARASEPGTDVMIF
jgi:hypothetical protein